MKHSGSKENGGKKKRRWLLAVLIGLLVVIAAGAGWLWYTQGSNLKALYLATTSDKDSLEQKQQEQDKKRDEILEEYGLQKPDASQTGGETTSPTGEPTASPTGEPTASPTGEPTDSTAGEPTDPETTARPVQTSPPAQETAQPSDDPADEQAQLQAQLQEKVNQLYAVEAAFRGQVESIVAQAKAEFIALPKDQRNQSNKMAIVNSKANALIAMEQQCDAQVSAIVADVRSILQQMGKSTALADEINSYYQESKANWKAIKMTELFS